MAGGAPAGQALDPASEPRVLHRVRTERGELVLRRCGRHFEIISNGTFLMDTRDGRSERSLVRAALDRCAAAAPTVLIGGLGVGFSLAEAVADRRVATITVVEVEAAVIGWYRHHLRRLTLPGPDDGRVRIVRADLRDWLHAAADRYDVICLDVDNGPGWTVVPGNGALYGERGLATLLERLNPAGVLAVWSANRCDDFEERLRRHAGEVTRQETPMPRGGPDIVYLARRPA